MREGIGLSRIIASLTATVLAVAGLCAFAAIAEAKGENVTFINKSRRAQELLVAFGGDAACSEMPKQESLRIEPNEEALLESGDSRVCWCAGSGKVPVTQCGEWEKAKPGSNVRIHF